MSLIKDISSILEYGKMSTSNKYAVLLALFDYIIEHPSEQAANNFHLVPIVYIARQFAAYYWPFSFSSIVQGKSISQEKNVRVVEIINDFKAAIETRMPSPAEAGQRLRKALAEGEAGFKWVELVLDTNDVLPKPLVSMLAQIMKRVLASAF